MIARFVPVNFSVGEVAKKVPMLAIEQTDAGVVVPTPDQLDNWATENYVLDVTGAMDLGFPVGNFTASARDQVLVFGFSRYKDVQSDTGYSYRYGVSLRALVVVTSFKGDGALTLPVLAAKVQLDFATAEAQMLVRGYTGALKLPTWQSFGIDGYAEYIKTVSEIQDKIAVDPSRITPELLATAALSPSLPSTVVGVGIFYALDSISRQRSLLQALQELKEDEPRLSATVKTVYSGRIHGDENVPPDQAEADAAKVEMGRLRLDHGILAGIRD